MSETQGERRRLDALRHQKQNVRRENDVLRRVLALFAPNPPHDAPSAPREGAREAGLTETDEPLLR